MALINDNDMEVIMKADQENVIRKMLNDRLFCLIKLPIKKPAEIIGRYSSSVFVAHMNNHLVRSLAIRPAGSKVSYEECEYFLSMYHSRGIDEEKSGIFKKGLLRKQIGRRISSVGEAVYLSVDELIDFLNGKELFLITNYMHYGNMEALKTEDFLEDILFIWENRNNEYVRREEKCEVRIYLTGIYDGKDDNPFFIMPIDVRKLKLEQHIFNILKKKSLKFYPKEYYSVLYETQSETVQSANFTTRFHSNTAWEADPINYVYVRISAFVIPSKVSAEALENTPKNKITTDCNGNKYIIDSIHFNSDIFSDIAEFEKYMDSYFCYFGMD